MTIYLYDHIGQAKDKNMYAFNVKRLKYLP